VIVRALIACRFLRRAHDAASPELEHQLVDERDREHDRADGHRQLRQPQRRGVVAGGHVVQHVRLPGEAATVEGEEKRQQRRGQQGADLEHAARTALQRGDDQRDADVLAFLQRVGQRQEAGPGHHVARVGVHAGHVEMKLSAGDGQQHHHQQRHHEKRRQGGGAVVERVERLPQRARHHIFL
jgi:hypothetical protein